MSAVALEDRVDDVQRDDSYDESGSDVRQFVTFLVGDEVFAVDLMPVQEIIRLPSVVRVPLAPAALDGLANLRGKVLPIIALRRLFGLADREADDATRAVVVDVGQPVGLVVDRVTSVVAVEPGKIESAGAIKSVVDTDLISGLIKDAGGHAVIMVLDFIELIAREFAQITASSQHAALAGALSQAELVEEADNDDELQLVSFEVAGQEYAVAITDVQEIVQVPETITQVPRAAAHVLGVINLRDRLLPLMNLRRLFALPDRRLDEKSRVVVLTLDGASVGIGVDAVSEVLRVSKACLEAMPPLLAREGDLADITGICRLEDGKRLVSIIEARNLFDCASVKEALSAVNDIDDAAVEVKSNDGELLDDDDQVVIFRLDSDEFGVPIANVQEIVRVPEELIRVPRAPSFVEGVVNLRGSVLPVIDLRKRLGMDSVERNDRQRIVVFLIDAIRTGFIVDQVAEVLKIPNNAIEAAPNVSEEQGRLLSRMANLEKQKRMVQLIDPAYLVEKQDRADLSMVSVAG